MDFWTLIIALIGGFMAGCINLLAGNGSAITLTILTELMGLPPNVANGTNRIGVLANSIMGIAAFARKGKRDLTGTGQFVMTTITGGILGIYLATVVSDELFKNFFKGMMLVMLLVVLFKPDRWIRQAEVTRHIPSWIAIPVYFAIGVYGGFIQMGMGIFFLVITVFVARFEVIKANYAKMIIVLVFTAFSLVMFSLADYLHWQYGLLLAVGQGLGAWVMGIYSARSPKAGLIAYYMLIAGMILAVVKLFDLHLYFF